MSKVEEIENLIKTNIDNVYESSASRIVSDYNRENRLKGDYTGRQIFELLQNADDCGKGTERNICVRFEVEKEEDGGGFLLAIMNTGEPFSVDGIRSLLISDVSSKKKYVSSDSSTIGYMGLGFRSVLNWACSVDIVTRDFTVSFSEDLAKSKLKRCQERLASKVREKDSAVSKKDLDDLEKGGLERTAILASCSAKATEQEDVNRWLKSESLSGGEYATAILLHNVDIDEHEKEFAELQLQPEDLIFLKHVSCVEIDSPNVKQKLSVAESKVSDGSSHLEMINENGEAKFSSCWRLWKRQVKETDGAEIAVAYNEDEKARDKIRDETGYLYSYFRTDVRMPYPVLIHGDFALTSNRRSLIPDNEKNRRLFSAVEDLMIDVSEEIKTSREECDYVPLSILVRNDKVQDGGILKGDGYGFFDDFKKRIKDEVKKHSLLPSVCGEYRRHSDDLRYSDSTQSIDADETDENGKKKKKWFADVLDPGDFDVLLKRCEDRIVEEYLKINVKSCIGEDGLTFIVDGINRHPEKYIDDGRYVDLMRLLREHFYRPGCPDSYLRHIPHFIVDGDDSLVYVRSESSSNIDMPDWADMKVMDRKTMEDLMPYFGPVEQMAENLKAFGARKYDLGHIVEGLVARSTDAEDEAEKARRVNGLVKWLYEYWKRDSEELPIDSLKGLFVTSREGDVVSADDCYLGEEYGYGADERITGHIAGVKYLAAAESFDIDAGEDGNLKDFLYALGLRELPRFRLRHLSKEEGLEFLKYTCTSFGEKFSRLTISHYSKSSYTCDDIERWLNLEFVVRSPDGLENILQEADFEDIVHWLSELGRDETGKKYIDDKFEVEPNPVSGCTWINHKGWQDVSISNSQIHSWFRYKLATIPWIPVNGGKCAFSRCTISDDNFRPFIKSLDDAYWKGKKGSGALSKETKDLFKRIGMPEYIVDLPKETIYDLLLCLPEFKDEKNGTDCWDVIQLYRQIESKYVADNEEYNLKDLTWNNPKRDDFLKNGAILAKVNGGYKYYPASEVYYLDRTADFSEDILEEIPRIDISSKRGGEKIKTLFGVAKFRDVKITLIDKAVHSFNPLDDFDEEFESLKPFIYASRKKAAKKNEDLSSLKRLRVVLLDDAEVGITSAEDGDEAEDGEKRDTVYLKDYQFVDNRKERIAYLKIPRHIKTIAELRGDSRYQLAISSAVAAFFDSSSETKIYSLIFSKDCAGNDDYFSGDDDFCTLLPDAKREFNSSDEEIAERDFWERLAEASGRKPDEVRNMCKGRLSSNFNFVNLRNLELDDVEGVRRMFVELGTDLDKFNRGGYNRIDFAGANRSSFNTLKATCSEKYKYRIALSLVRDSENEGKTIDDFIVKTTEYNRYEYDGRGGGDVLNFDAEREFEAAFGIAPKDLPEVGEDFAELKNVLSERLKTSEESRGEAEKKSVGAFSSSIAAADETDYADLTKKIDSKPSVVYSTSFVQSGGTEKSPDNHKSAGGNSKSAKSRSGWLHERDMEDSKEKNGYSGEYAVYKELLAREGRKEIVGLKWVSGNAKKFDPTSGDILGDDCGYDISYLEGKTMHYVDVKSSSTGKKEFQISKKECDKGLEYSKDKNSKYDIWFVALGRDRNEIYILDDFFLSDGRPSFFGNKKYSVQTDDFSIKISESMESSLVSSEANPDSSEDAEDET